MWWAFAKHRWRTGHTAELGRALFEQVPASNRPIWAAGVLRCALTAIPEEDDVVTAVLACAGDPALWHEGHRVFDRVRREVLQLDDEIRCGRGKLVGPRHSLLSLAELVAKVTYNATCPQDGFDEDSGWYIAGHLRSIVDIRNDPAFERAAWSALASPGSPAR